MDKIYVELWVDERMMSQQQKNLLPFDDGNYPPHANRKDQALMHQY